MNSATCAMLRIAGVATFCTGRCGRVGVGGGGQDLGLFDIRGVGPFIGIDQKFLARLCEDHEFMRRLTPNQAGVGFDSSEGETATRKDVLVGVVHLLVSQLGAFLILVEAIGIFHDELAASHQAEAGSDFIPKLGLNLVAIQRELTIRTHLATDQLGDDLFMGRPEAEVAFVPVLESEQLLAVVVPAPGFAPELGRGGDRHQDLLGSGAVHLLTDDALDLSNDPQAQREIRVDACRDFADHSGSQHQAVADDLRLAGIFTEGRNQ